MRFGDALDHAISRIQIGTAGHRRIRFDGNAMLLAVRNHFALLPGRMQLNLVDRRILAGLRMQTIKMLRKEIAHTQRLHTAFGTELLERLPRLAGTPVERSGPVQHVHVNVIELQEAELAVESLACGVIPLFGITQFGGDPQILTILTLCEAHVLQRTAHTGLIVVPGGAVDMAVSHFERAFHHRSHAFVVNTQNTEADLGNQIAVVQGNHRSMESGHGFASFHVWKCCVTA